MQPRSISFLASCVVCLSLLSSGCFLFPQKPAASPCATNNGGCSANATCSLNALSQVMCACNGGYIGNGMECTPEVTGPCATNNGGCSPDATCSDSSGSVTCTCDPGYTGDGMTCTAEGDSGNGNPCDPSPCDPHATCALASDGGAACTCDNGYTGDGFTCTPEEGNPCSSNPCGPNSTCTDNGGTAECTCDPGYESPFGDGTDCTLIPDAGSSTDAGLGTGVPGSSCSENSQCETGLCLTAESECSLAECTLPSPFPSHGSCVTRVAGETDAGVYDGGYAVRNVCNPITNAGCTGGTFCYPDYSGEYYFCQQPLTGGPSGVAVCGDCTAETATCAGGNLCLPVDTNELAWQCAHMCCTDADCGTGNTCSQLSPSLGGDVGYCTPG